MKRHMIKSGLIFGVLGVCVGGGSAFAAPAYSDAVLATPGLSAYWRLNETGPANIANTWADASGNGHTGTQTISAARDPVQGVAGPNPSNGFPGFEVGNTADNFPNRNQSILAQDAPSLNPGTGDFTMEAWFQTTNTTAATMSILGKHDASGAADGYLMPTNYWDLANHDAAARFRDAGAAHSIDVPSPGFATAGNAGGWHQMVAVLHRTGNGSSYANSGMSVYLDGTLAGFVNSTVLDGADITNTKEFTIGAANRDGSSGFSGNIDEVSLYSRALSPAEVSAHFSAAVTAVPEPASVALVAIGMFPLARGRRPR